MSGIVSMKDVIDMPIDYVRDFVRRNVPPNVHFWLSHYQLRLLALRILDEQGRLSDSDSKILRTPLFGEIYVKEKGDIGATLFHLGVDML